MESESFQEYKTLKCEITKGMEQVKELRASSSGNQERLLERMLASYEEAQLILKGSSSEGQDQSVISSSSNTPDSLIPVSGVQSEGSSRGSNPSKNDKSWKRRVSPKFTKHVRVSSDVSYEGLDDGHSWRKYGQKEILGSRYPRTYLRCTKRSIQGCLATKQVQRSDVDPCIFKVTYYNKHTCISPASVAPPLALSEKQE